MVVEGGKGQQVRGWRFTETNSIIEYVGRMDIE